MLILEDPEQLENNNNEFEDEMNEMPTIIDVLMGYKHDSDKIIVIGKFIETILNYIEKLEATNLNMSNYLEYLYSQMNNYMNTVNTATISQQIQIIHNRIDDMENRFEKLIEIQMNMNKLQPMGQSLPGDGIVTSDIERRIVGEISGVRTKISDLEEKISSFQSQLTKIQSAGIASASKAPAAPSLEGYRGGPPPPPAPRREVVEESLLKPSSFGGGPTPSGGGGGAAGGGMSIRMAMMNEIRARMNKRAGGEVPKSQGGTGEVDGEDKGYALPRIHQPREAKSLEGGLVSKMNKLLDSKFQQQGSSGSGGIQPGNKTGPPRGPPGTAFKGPPKGPPKGPSQDNLLSSVPIGGLVDDKKDKGKDKKKDKKDKGKEKKDKGKDDDSSDIANRLASIDEALEGL